MRIQGSIISGYTNERTGLFQPVDEQKNLILYGGADIVASLLSGSSGLRISSMYFQYINQASYSHTPAAITRESGRESFDLLTGADHIDYLRVPIFTTPHISPSPADTSLYTGNSVMFTATSANVGNAGSITGLTPAHNYFASTGANGASHIFSVALAATPDPRQPASDVLFSRLNLATPLTVIANSHPTIFWSIRIS